MPIPVVDLFAGPGGLSEGFEGYRNGGERPFRCALSIEKERYAHQTLLLRAFFRQFAKPPKEYYGYLRGELTLKELFARYPRKHERAKTTAVRLTLARWNRKRIDRMVRNAVRGHQNNWVLIGGPPCQAYSLVGRARRTKEKRREFEKDGRHFLFKEYLRIVRKFRPPVFVMENVKGLLSSSAKGVEIFELMLKDFSAAGYSLHSFVKKGEGKALEPIDYVIEAERYAIPQSRHRVILLGVRKGRDRGSRRLPEAKKKISIQAAIGDLPDIRSHISPPSRDSYEAWESELRRLHSVVGRNGRLKGRKIGPRTLRKLGGGGEFIRIKLQEPRKRGWLRRFKNWLIDRRIEGVTLHAARHHMPTDLRRYLFASHYSRLHGESPRIADFPWWIRPKHKNVRKAVKESLFADRFRVQIRGKPSSTVVAHISKDGHYYIHYDPRQCRSLTVREVARLQTFPDNYYFQGTRTAQYQQVGNAVPPLLARQMAAIVRGILADG
jgi:DNA (cytosine-5)-methyltransferase 1